MSLDTMPGVGAAPAKKSNMKSWIMLAVVAILIAGAAYYVFAVMPKGSTAGTTSSSTAVTLTPREASDYTAVFLVNNQVYFGKLGSSINSQFVSLEDVYYLQVQQQIQPASKDKKASDQPNISLIKLGGELHGPTDTMQINRDQILLIEDLRTDSNLVAAIRNYKAGNK